MCLCTKDKRSAGVSDSIHRIKLRSTPSSLYSGKGAGSTGVMNLA